MCGGGKAPAPAPAPAPKPVDPTVAERGTDTAADASLRPQAATSSATTGLGGAENASGTGTQSVLGG
jgi:hypothetical protein